MNIYSTEILLCATVYVRAESEEEARVTLNRHYSEGEWCELPKGEGAGIIVSAADFASPDMPEISISPAVTSHGRVDASAIMDLVEGDGPEPGPPDPKPYLSPTGARITGTAEMIPGEAGIIGIYDDGSPAYGGWTDMQWNDQEPVTREGKIVFLDENGERWTFDQLKLAADDLGTAEAVDSV